MRVTLNCNGTIRENAGIDNGNGELNRGQNENAKFRITKK